VNALDVQAIGWIVTRDLWRDAARAFTGLKPRFDRASLDALASRWVLVTAALSDDHDTTSGIARIVRPRRMPLSARSERAMQAFIRQLVAACPQLYCREALRTRCLGGLGRLIGSFVGCFILACYVAPETALVARASLGFFLVGCWSFATTFQLFVAHRLVARFASHEAAWHGREPVR
jgi:hypothetical protein